MLLETTLNFANNFDLCTPRHNWQQLDILLTLHLALVVSVGSIVPAFA